MLLGLGMALPAFAVSPSSILVDVVPENPAPNSNVNITLRSFAANLDSVSISWFVNEKSVLSGIGKKSFSVTAGAAGSEITVLVKVFLPDGEIDKTIIIRPSRMILLWQANDSYVPPFYKGKALPVADSEIKVVAMPEIQTTGGMVNPKNMTYFWKKDYGNEQGASGYGKNFFLYVNDFLESSNNVSVEASTVDQKFSSSASIDIGAVSPEILFYKKDNNLGIIWEQALLDGYRIQGEEVIVAAPYFIAPQDIRRPDLVWNWSINDHTVEAQIGRKNILPLKAEEGTSGTAKLRLDIENKYKIFQTASKEILIRF